MISILHVFPYTEVREKINKIFKISLYKNYIKPLGFQCLMFIRPEFGRYKHQPRVRSNVKHPNTRLIVILCSRFSYYPRRGFAYYKGPQLVEDVYFAGFEKNDYYKSGALSWQLNNVYFTSIYSWVKNALFAFNDSVSTYHIL